MIEHHMLLNESAFDLMAAGTKRIEARLYDEKRRELQFGDTIVFTKRTDSAEVLAAEVGALYRYDTFAELFASFPPAEFGGEGESVENLVEDMRKYYSEEQEHEYGVLGIQVKVRQRLRGV